MGINQDVSDLQSRVTALESRATTDETRLSSDESRLSTDEGTINSLETSVASDEARISSLEQRVGILEESLPSANIVTGPDVSIGASSVSLASKTIDFPVGGFMALWATLTYQESVPVFTSLDFRLLIDGQNPASFSDIPLDGKYETSFNSQRAEELLVEVGVPSSLILEIPIGTHEIQLTGSSTAVPTQIRHIKIRFEILPFRG